MAIHLFGNLAAGQKQTVVVYGTSLTHGGAWARAMRDWFEANYPGLVTFINSAGPGENSDWGVRQLKENVLAHHPDLVFIEFSYNDAHDKFEMSLERGAENLDQIVTMIRRENPQTDIVLQTMNVGWDAPNGNKSLTVRPQLNAFNENYRHYAKTHDLPLLDHYLSWQKLKETDLEKFQRFVPDGSHPTEEGSLALTWPTVQAFLEKSRAGISPGKR